MVKIESGALCALLPFVFFSMQTSAITNKEILVNQCRILSSNVAVLVSLQQKEIVARKSFLLPLFR